jgi:DNA repair protein RadD
MDAREKYQALAIAELWASLFIRSKALCVMATGSGKTWVFSKFIKMAKKKKYDFSCLVLVNQVRLVEQAVKSINEVSGEDLCSIYCHSLGEKDMSKVATVGTIQSIFNYPKRFNLIIVDEAHTLSKRHLDFIKRCREINPRLKVMGFTATPFNKDGLIYGEGKFFEKLDYQLSIEKIRDMGFLVPYTLKSSKDKFDVSKLKKYGNDYRQKELDELTKDEKKIYAQVEDMMSRVGDRKKIVILCINIRHSEMISEAISCYEDCIVQHSKIKESRLGDFEKGSVRFLASVNQVSEGYDFPLVDCIVFMRPTRSPRFMVQAVGRGLRIADGKKNCLVLDYGDVFMHCGTPDKPVIFEKESKSSGKKAEVKATIKVCPSCQAYVGVSFEICDCGHKFKAEVNLKKLNEKPSLSLGFVQTPRQMLVSAIKYEPEYVARSGRVTPRVTFFTSYGKKHTYLFSEKQKNWFEWKSQGGRVPPKTISLDDPYKTFPKITMNYGE